MADPRYIGITMGCPVGIGPEIILKFLKAAPQPTSFQPVVLGDPGVLARTARALSLGLEIVPWSPTRAALQAPGTVAVLELSRLEPSSLGPGRPTLETGRAMGRYIQEAVRLVQNDTLAAITTCPITKTGLRLGGYPFSGHTEMLASLCRVSDYAMMMAGSRLRVTLVTIHVALGAVPALLTREEVLRVIMLTGRSLKQDFGIRAPRVAVAGLNPHAGESGLFGDEEERIIGPAIAAAEASGLAVSGPFPPDTVFHRAGAGDFDAVVCMYHDQGLIPFKLLHFVDGVNVTIGLPLVRTSVDHGTAYDIAGQGKADPSSLAAAYGLAEDIVSSRSQMTEDR
ncbi:MAG: 4-hydroxythreonine-4-phosphate dehydrogenase PdxA [Desulfobacterales bacterium]|nr:4-hydroxythreonine-4-phosphate dehydrogenase PdxA [Desulfobacterales bacterium]